MEENKNFYCYSIQLKDFLSLQGIRYITCSRHYKSGNRFWVYPNSTALDDALVKWDLYKKTFWKEK